jgi:hypothetical protein
LEKPSSRSSYKYNTSLDHGFVTKGEKEKNESILFWIGF